MTSSSPLLDLPAELRLQIYAYALAPTSTLFLTRTGTRRFATVPALSIPLLRTCKQICNEAMDLIYAANEVVISVDAHNSAWPVLAEDRLPQRVLEKLEHVFIILDCSQAFMTVYEAVDFDSFGALISLRTLRLAVIYDAGSARAPPERISSSWADEGSDVKDLMSQVLARIPQRTKILCGVTEGTPQMDCLEMLLENRRQSKGKNTGSVKSFTAMEMEDAVRTVPDEVKGSKSGGNTDVFAEYHDKYSGRTCMWRSAGIQLNFD